MYARLLVAVFYCVFSFVCFGCTQRKNLMPDCDVGGLIIYEDQDGKIQISER